MKKSFTYLLIIAVALLSMAILNGCFGTNISNGDLDWQILTGQGQTESNGWTPGGFGDYIVFVSDRTDSPQAHPEKAETSQEKGALPFTRV